MLMHAHISTIQPEPRIPVESASIHTKVQMHMISASASKIQDTLSPSYFVTMLVSNQISRVQTQNQN